MVESAELVARWGELELPFSVRRSARRTLRIVVSPEGKIAAYAPEQATDEGINRTRFQARGLDQAGTASLREMAAANAISAVCQRRNALVSRQTVPACCDLRGCARCTSRWQSTDTGSAAKQLFRAQADTASTLVRIAEPPHFSGPPFRNCTAILAPGHRPAAPDNSDDVAALGELYGQGKSSAEQ